MCNLITETVCSLHSASEEHDINSLIHLFQFPVLQTEDGNLLNSANSICRFKLDVITVCLCKVICLMSPIETKALLLVTF